MQLNRVNHHVSDNTAGVSEIIGAILLIMIVVSAVALIGVILFSQQTPEKIPNINFMTGTDNSGNLYLYHNGGDALKNGEFAVRVDGVLKPYTISDNSDTWSLGKNLKILGVPSGTHYVAIIYNGTSGAESSVLRSGSSSSSVFSGTINPDTLPSSVGSSGGLDTSNPQNVINFILGNTSLIGDAMNQSPSTVGPVIANVVGANSINFFKDNKVALDGDNIHTYFFKYNVTQPGSSIAITGYHPNPKPLLVGDVVTIYMRGGGNTKNFKTFGLGNQLWEISATGVDVSLSHFTTPDIESPQSNTDVSHAWITGYQDLGAALRISTSGNGVTSLVVNGTQYINGADSTSVIITNIRPVGIGLFLLEVDNNAQIVYFVGNAQSVTRNGVPIV